MKYTRIILALLAIGLLVAPALCITTTCDGNTITQTNTINGKECTGGNCNNYVDCGGSGCGGAGCGGSGCGGFDFSSWFGGCGGWSGWGC